MIKRLLIILPTLSIIVVALYFVLTTIPYIRYWADDFCASTILRSNGYFGAQVVWWKTWTGRYSFIAILDIFEKLGAWSVRITPIVVLPLLVITILPAMFSSVLLASLFIILTLINAPNITQSFYWQMGSINYTAGFIFFNLFLSLLVYKKRDIKPIIPFILLFIAGGFSEPFAIAQGVLVFFSFLAVLIIKPKDKTHKIKLVLAGLAGTALSLVVMLLSPGNTIREMGVTRPESLMFVISSTILGTKWYLLRMLAVKPFLYSLVIIFSSVFLMAKKFVMSLKKSLYVMVLAFLAAVFTTMAVAGSGFYSMSIIPPERTLFIAIYFILICFVAFSLVIKSFLVTTFSPDIRKVLFWGIIFLNMAASILLIKSIFIYWRGVRSNIQNYAQEFDRIEPALIKSSGKSELRINNIAPVGELDSFTDNNGWVTSCLATYYKIGGIKISPK